MPDTKYSLFFEQLKINLFSTIIFMYYNTNLVIQIYTEVLIVVFPCMLTIIQLLFQINAQVFYY
jgi:hypothetical protein